MSGAAGGSSATSKLGATKDDSTAPASGNRPKAAQLQEDDEFEDFPVEDWAREEEVSALHASGTGITGGSGSGSNGNSTHLWEESWDDDDTTDDFAQQLKEELKKTRKS